MTAEQKAAFINAQAALMQGQIAGMQAENTWRQLRGESLAYTEEAFAAVVKEYEGIIGWNAAIALFHD